MTAPDPDVRVAVLGLLRAERDLEQLLVLRVEAERLAVEVERELAKVEAELLRLEREVNRGA
ncbi:MAG: hypothetical protein AB7T09_37270 [Planctomycetota bacterium]